MKEDSQKKDRKNIGNQDTVRMKERKKERKRERKKERKRERKKERKKL